MTRKIDYAAETMATSYSLARPLDVYAKRLKRLQDSYLEDVYRMLKSRQETTGQVYATREWKDSKLARGLRDGIEEFKNKHPEHAKEIEGMIKKQRRVRRNYVSFEFNGLPDEAYYQVLIDVGIPKETAEDTLQAIMDMANHLEEVKQPIRLLVD